MLRAVIFDLDKTLHDKLNTLGHAGLAQHEKFQLASRGIAASEWIACYVALHDEEIPKTQVFTQLGKHFALDSTLERGLLEDFDSHSADHAQAFPGMDALIDGVLEAGLKTALVSNGRDFIQRHKCRTLGLDNRLDVLITSGGLGISKPDPRIFQHALDALNVSPHEAIFVGDSLAHDILPARALGLATIWKSAHSDNAADFCADDLLAIREEILRRLA